MNHNENENENEMVLHVAMGVEQATLVGIGLGLLLCATENDLALLVDDNDENAADEFMRLLGVKMDATTMFRSLWQTLGAPDKVIDKMLTATSAGEFPPADWEG